MSSPEHLFFRTDPSLDGTGRGTARESLTAALLALFSLLRTICAIWTKNNPQPWNTVKPNENVKLMSVNQKFDKRCVHVLFRPFTRCSYY